MELTKQQLQRVEHYLNVKGIDYVDFRLEVLDHIISDIETKMQNESLDFETTFYSVTDKWNIYLKQTSSPYFGVQYTLPKIVLKKAKKSFRKYFFLFFLAYLIPYILVDKISIILSKDVEKGLILIFQTVTVLSFILFVYLFIKKSQNRIKTTYSFILKTQSVNILIGTFVFLDFNSVSQEGILNPFNVGLLSCFIFTTYCYFHFYKKHKEVIKKYKIS